MAKLWAGRFEKPTSALLDDFQSSIPFDQRLLACDVTGSIAHATMLGEQGIIPQEDAQRIVEGLRGILDDYHAGTLTIDMGAEDVHMFVEALLTERIGEAASACTPAAAATTRWPWTCACTRAGPAAMCGRCCFRCFRCSAPCPRNT